MVKTPEEAASSKTRRANCKCSRCLYAEAEPETSIIGPGSHPGLSPVWTYIQHSYPALCSCAVAPHLRRSHVIVAHQACYASINQWFHKRAGLVRISIRNAYLIVSSYIVVPRAPSAEATEMANTSEYAVTAVLSLAAVAGFVFLLRCQATKHDPREPPLIPQPVFWIGHLLGLIRKGSRYYANVR